MIDSTKKWKYATFAVLGVLALVLTTPPAFAATSDINKLTQQILEGVRAIQLQLNTLTNGATANLASILSAIAGVSDDIADAEDNILDAIPDQGVKDYRLSITPQQPCCAEQKFILPVSAGYAYVGHLKGQLFSSEGQAIEYRCVFDGGVGGGVLASVSGDDFENFNFDFACPALAIYGFDPGDLDDGDVSANGRVSFTKVPYSELESP